MKSKVHPRYKTKYRVANWAAYNQALVRRGDVTVWLSSEAIAAWTPRRSGRRGGQRRYSDLAIETALTLRLLYHLPLRQAEGFLHALFGMMRLDLSAPDYTTLSRRSQHLTRRLRPVPTDEGIHLVLDSTGLSLVGEGEWAAAKHGGRGRRGWRKLHLGVDQSGVIRVHTLTEETGDDATTALDLLTAVESPVRLEFPILSGESAPPVWRQANVDHVGSWRATAPRRPAAPSRHVCSVRCSTATRYPPNARRTEARCTRLSVLARHAAVAVERLAASGRLPVECVAVSARQTAASVAVGRARGDHWPDERVALPRVVVVYPCGAEPGLARPARRRRRCLQERPPVGRAAAAGQPAGVLMASPRTASGRASAERGRGRS